MKNFQLKWMLSSLALAMAQNAHAVEYNFGDAGALTVHGNLSIGAAIRTAEQNQNILPSVNSSTIGVPGNTTAPATGKNQDDGDLNYKKGDFTTQIVQGSLNLDYHIQNYGVVASAYAWYDTLLENSDVPYGNSINLYSPNRPLSDSGANNYSRFSNIAMNSLYAYGKNSLGADNAYVNWKAGLQKIAWGNNFFTAAGGGLRDLSPINYPALFRPGATEDEKRIAIPALTFDAHYKASTFLGFYQFGFVPNSPNQCGTFYSALDFVAPGCDSVMLGAKTDQASTLSNNYIRKAYITYPEKSGSTQAGIGYKYKIESTGTELGFYGTQFDSRQAFYGVIKSARTKGNPYVAGNADGLNPQYFVTYPSAIRMYSFTLDQKVGANGAFFAEFNHRPNQPMQYSAADLIAAFTAPATTKPAPLLRGLQKPIAAGGTFNGWQDVNQNQLMLGGSYKFQNILGAKTVNVGAEYIYRYISDLPEKSVVRFGRPDVYGIGPVGGQCTGDSVQCSEKGYVSKVADALRIRISATYPNVIDKVSLTTGVVYGNDLKGWTGDGTIIEGRQFGSVFVKALINKMFTAELAWLPTWGGTYNNASDRSSANMSLGVRF